MEQEGFLLWFYVLLFFWTYVLAIFCYLIISRELKERCLIQIFQFAEIS